MEDSAEQPPAAQQHVSEDQQETNRQMLETIRTGLSGADASGLVALLSELHPADGSDLLEQLGRDEFADLIALLGDDFPADILVELRDEVRADAVEALPDEAVSAVLPDLETDDAAAILEDVEEDRRARILDELAPSARAPLERAFDFDEETAGRLMQRDFVAAPEFWTVGHTIDHARQTGDALPEQFFEIYVVDPGFKVLGAVSLALLLRTPREVKLSAIMSEIEAQITTQTDQEEAAYLFQKYSLASAPVVDEAGRITGMITVDDMVDVIQEENTEDLLALSGVRSADGSDTVWDSVKARAPWLGINLFTAFLASGIISLFEPVLSAYVALAILMPVVAALGGNAGSQALTVTVRAIAEREMQGAAALRAVRREVLTGAANGFIFALGVGGMTLLWFGVPMLALTIASAIFATFVWGGFAGILVPLGLQKCGVDPAVASSVFVLTLTDIVAFFSFLGLATLILL